MRRLLTFVVSTLAAMGSARSAANLESDRIVFAPGQQVIEIYYPSKVPQQLARAVARRERIDECRLADNVGDRTPVRIIKPANGSIPFALIPCKRVYFISYRLYIFDSSARTEPEYAELPAPALQRGMGLTNSYAGSFQWDASAETLIWQTVNDMIPSRVMKMIYSYSSHFGAVPFALERVEVSNEERTAWRVIWEAPVWKPLLD